MVEKLRYTVDCKLPAFEEARRGDGERDRVRVEKWEAEGERDRARVEKRQAEGERDRARVEKQEAEEERDRARVEKRETKEERDRARVELQRAQERVDQLQQMLDEFQGREHERSILQEQAIAAEQRGPSWEVKGDELEVTEERLGVGGWAEVKVAKLKVAAKCLHEQLIYDYHRRLFRREMDVAARVSHPNLLRFLGARLGGGMAILTEFMPTSLRALANRRPRQRLSQEHIISIAIDVACALNYLHHMTPDPIIHRDLSSANVLLQPTPNGGGWPRSPTTALLTSRVNCRLRILVVQCTLPLSLVTLLSRHPRWTSTALVFCL